MAFAMASYQQQRDAAVMEKPMSPPVQSRFKVVILESKKPFHRGRWQCFDYVDKTSDNEFAERLEVKDDQDERLHTPDNRPTPFDADANSDLGTEGDFASIDNEQAAPSQLTVENDSSAVPPTVSDNADPIDLGSLSATDLANERDESAHVIPSVTDDGANTAENDVDPFNIEVKIEQCMVIRMMRVFFLHTYNYIRPNRISSKAT